MRSNHNILTLTYPQETITGGPAAKTWTYGVDPAVDSTFDRVLSVAQGGTNASGVPAGGTTTYTYETINQSLPPNMLALPRLKVTIAERNGTVYETYFNERKQQIITRRLTQGFRVGESLYYETISVYNPDGMLVSKILPEGNQIVS